MSAPPSIRKLLARYNEDKEDFHSGKLTEGDLMRAYIEPLLRALGWDPEPMSVGSSQTVGRFKFDYLISYGGALKLGVEALSPRFRLEHAHRLVARLRLAAWRAGISLLVLTNLEELACYRCEERPDHGDLASSARLLYLKSEELEQRWDELRKRLSRQALDSTADKDETSEEASDEESSDEEDDTPARHPASSPGDELLLSHAHISRIDMTVHRLYRRWRQREIHIQEASHSNSAWRRQDVQSRLIESVLLRIPLPAIYLAEEQGGELTVIDGQERLRTLFSFLENKLELRGLDLLPSYNEKTFHALESRLQRRIEDAVLTAFVVHFGMDPAIESELVLRLNPGWTAHEVRGVVYRGPGLELVRELARPDRRLQRMIRLRAARQSAIEEYALRMLAFICLEPEHYSGTMPGFLTEALVRLNHMSDHERKALNARITVSLQIIDEIFGSKAFRRYDPAERRFAPFFNVALMDIFPWGFVTMPRDFEFWLLRATKLKEAVRDLHGNKQFVESISSAVNSRSHVLTRFRMWKETLQHVANSDT